MKKTDLKNALLALKLKGNSSPSEFAVAVAKHDIAYVFRDFMRPEEEQKVIDSHIRKAKDVDEFIDRILADETLRRTFLPEYLISRFRPGAAWMRVRTTLGDRVFKTESEAGSVLIGVNGFHFSVHNGRGDGVTRVAVVDKDDEDFPFIHSLMSNGGAFEGENIAIHAFDCSASSPVVKTISGRYTVHVLDGIVVFHEYE